MKDFIKKDEASWRCSCGGPHYVTMTRWGDDNWTYVDVSGAFRGGSRFLAKLKTAWAVLRNGHASDWIELVLDDPAKVDEIIAFLTDSAIVLRGGKIDD